MDKGFVNALKIANKKHDVVALRIFDEREMNMPEIGIVQIQDNETGEIKWIDTSNSEVQKSYKAKALKHDGYLKELFAKSGVDAANINTAASFVRPLINLFKMRERRR